MKLVAISGTAVVAVLLAGCVTAPPMADAVLGRGAVAAAGYGIVPDAERDPDRDYVCEPEPRPGSHIPRSLCRSVRRDHQEPEPVQEAKPSEGGAVPKRSVE